MRFLFSRLVSGQWSTIIMSMVKMWVRWMLRFLFRRLVTNQYEYEADEDVGKEGDDGEDVEVRRMLRFIFNWLVTNHYQHEGSTQKKIRDYLGIFPKRRTAPPFWEFRPFFTVLFWSSWKFLGDFKVF